MIEKLPKTEARIERADTLTESEKRLIMDALSVYLDQAEYLSKEGEAKIGALIKKIEDLDK